MNAKHPPPITEEQVLEALRRVPQERWGAVLGFLADQEEGARLAAEFDPANPLAQKLTARLQGWDYELPSYKYDVIFTSLDSLLKPVETKKPAEKGPEKGKTSKKSNKKAEGPAQ